MSKWAEIRCDYLCEDPDDMFWRVDAWLTHDDWEEGKVIAYIDDMTGRVVYVDPDARWDEYALNVIAEKTDEILSGLSEKVKEIRYCFDENGTSCCQLRLQNDETVVYPFAVRYCHVEH